jgi:amino acid transporter
VLVLRRTQPDLERGFRVPASPLLPLLSAAATAWLAVNLSVDTWRNFAIWIGIGVMFYFSYGYWQSRMARAEIGAGDGPGGAPDGASVAVPQPRPEPARPGKHAASRRG